MSKEEALFSQKMDEIFKGVTVIKNWRPDRLKSEATGHNLELDYYIGRFTAGFEYQGGIHFKDIKEYGNNSDASRRNDYMKSDISLADLKYIRKPLSIIEIFEYDLKGSFKDNLINRIQNTKEFYLKKEKYFNVRNLIFLLCFLQSNYYYNRRNLVKGLIPLKYSFQLEEIKKKIHSHNLRTIFDTVPN